MIERLYVPVVGGAGVGKSEVTSYLAKKWGFDAMSVSDEIRKFAKAHGMALHSRADYLAAHEQMVSIEPHLPIMPAIKSPHSRVAIDGLRVTAHLEHLSTLGDVTPIALFASDETRVARIQARLAQNNRDPQTPEEILADEEGDYYSDDPYGPNLQAIMDKAIIKIDTEGKPLERVFQYVDLVMPHLLEKPASS